MSLFAGDIPNGIQQVICKLMVSNAAAGSIIGKVGLLHGSRNH